jgi:hypothetical protein
VKIANETPFAAGWTCGFHSDGREVAVVSIKATYSLRLRAGLRSPALAETQSPLLEADVFGPDPARDAPRYENDFALFKPECDILIQALAHAPERRPVTRMTAGFALGPARKWLAVVGDRQWQRSWGSLGISEPVPFVTQEISYDVAFGGVDPHPTEPSLVETYLSNPAGTGFCRFMENIDGLALPNTEEPESAVSKPNGPYRPMAFGPLGRNWHPRYTYAGTYDERWQKEKLPFLPDDFDAQYFQAAPVDQRIPYPHGGEPLILIGLSAEGRLESALPKDSVFVTFLRRKGQHVEMQASLDTVLIEPENDRLYLTWRAGLPLNRDPFELREIVVERGQDRTRGRRRARLTDKTYYKNLADAVHRRRSDRSAS